MNPQESKWGGPKGDKYADTYQLTPKQVDAKWIKVISGVAKSEMNLKHIGRSVPKDAKILEVGCNVGNMMVMLKAQGWENVRGVELNSHAVEVGKKRGLDIRQGNARELPFEDGEFDLVYTCWVITHIHPDRLPAALDEIHRVSKRWISGCEPYAPGKRAIERTKDYLWSADFCGKYQKRHPLTVCNRKVYDVKVPRRWPIEMFLLEKKA